MTNMRYVLALQKRRSLPSCSWNIVDPCHPIYEKLLISIILPLQYHWSTQNIFDNYHPTLYFIPYFWRLPSCYWNITLLSCCHRKLPFSPRIFQLLCEGQPLVAKFAMTSQFSLFGFIMFCNICIQIYILTPSIKYQISLITLERHFLFSE